MGVISATDPAGYPVARARVGSGRGVLEGLHIKQPLKGGCERNRSTAMGPGVHPKGLPPKGQLI